MIPAYSQSSNCGKNISDQSDLILDSVDRQKAVSIAINDTDFRNLVGDSKYIAGLPEVEHEGFDQLNCRLVDPTIQIQFNVLNPNVNLNNCPYVIVMEDTSASKVLSVDLGSCNTSIEPSSSPINESSSLTLIIICGITISVVIGISFFVMRTKK